MALCLVALGANVGDRIATLSRAVAELANSPSVVLAAQSGWHETPPIGGPPDQCLYINGVVALETSLSPLALFELLRSIESCLGRQRDVRWGPRTVDLDLLLYDQQVIATPELTLPHPRMAFRRFVIEPAAEAAADMRHPVIGWTLRELRDHLRNAAPYVAVTGAAGTGKSRLAARLSTHWGARTIADPPRPHAVTADERGSTGRLYAAEIELLDLRRSLLDPRHGGDSEQKSVSDFWIAQSLAYAATWSDEQRQRDMAAAVERAVASVVRPKLLIFLDPASGLSRAVGGRPPTLPREAADGTADVRAALANEARRPGVGPLLQLTSADEEANLAEAAAAVAAMS